MIVTLTGNDFLGNSVTRTDTTDSSGMYMFADLQPGVYNLVETQPARYRDGKDSIGDNGDGIVTPADGLVAIDTNAEDDVDADAFGGIQLSGGADGVDYNFGELAGGVGASKIDHIRQRSW